MIILKSGLTIQAEIFKVKHLREITTNKKICKGTCNPNNKKKYLKKI